jgi:hypothetical protein
VGSITYQIEKIDIILDGNSIQNPQFSTLGGLVPFGTPNTTFYYPAFDANIFKGKKRVEGRISFVLKYGNADIGFPTRKLTKMVNVFFRLDDREANFATNATFVTTYESDENLGN